MAEDTLVEDAMSATLTIARPAAEVFAALADPTTTPRSTAPAGSGTPATGRR